MIGAAQPSAADAGRAPMRRSYGINMPQMALGGLSEAWLFRELGDLHWAMICEGLRAKSSEMADANGDRLYATFTRIRIESSVPLLGYRENDPLTAEAQISRFGGSVFLGEAAMVSGERSIRAQLMSSFTKRSDPDSNLSLLKGQPAIPAGCDVPLLPQLPSFAQEYRVVRAVKDRPVIHERRYDIQPHHDINGVGLLYFAAYPTINDLSELSHMANATDWCLNYSTVERDVYYFGNCNIDDKIIYRLHDMEHQGDGVRLTSSLFREKDNALIAHVSVVKRRLADGA
jgi:probable biosynthetic protein (TIGR04098 family)